MDDREGRNGSDRSQPSEVPRLYAQYGAIGLQFALTIGVFVYGGVWLDERWETSPWFTLVGALLGFVGGTISIAYRVFPR